MTYLKTIAVLLVALFVLAGCSGLSYVKRNTSIIVDAGVECMKNPKSVTVFVGWEVVCKEGEGIVGCTDYAHLGDFAFECDGNMYKLRCDFKENPEDGSYCDDLKKYILQSIPSVPGKPKEVPVSFRDIPSSWRL